MTAENQTPAYPVGSVVLSLGGETDCGDDGERQTGPRAWGHLESWAPECGYSAHFAYGVTVYITAEELSDARQYEVIAPALVAQRMRELQHYDAQLNAAGRAPEGGDYEIALATVGIATN